MSKKVSITLDEEVLEFVDRSSRNRSNYINEVLLREKKKSLLKELEDAYKEQSEDPEFLEEIAVWDVAVGDGLDA
ncbi:hypothetical protein [Gloeocapsopsis dulcis]|uniref:CopG family transcriptional regulator n=1 Tax=Gloeocapsopsis dulcis AAB1 = 1H9 TaxID=1433147 RepID=A0A6N8FW30_9CHRO|nr:hypothetical protein [Gloeocapsopsis dulcis]MUL37328.1 hypothetical protein [Gloeocapsopsis dulcis AAB1 = 1H9]WNN88963.1 hypothetical protein P0S91_22325 [Gloeocapsopsis dulcis]